MPVLRVDPKWAVSKSDFAGDVYPRYCSGIAVVLSLDVVLALSRVASRVPFFWVDDVFLTGLLPARYIEPLVLYIFYYMALYSGHFTLPATVYLCLVQEWMS